MKWSDCSTLHVCAVEMCVSIWIGHTLAWSCHFSSWVENQNVIAIRHWKCALQLPHHNWNVTISTIVPNPHTSLVWKSRLSFSPFWGYSSFGAFYTHHYIHLVISKELPLGYHLELGHILSILKKYFSLKDLTFCTKITSLSAKNCHCHCSFHENK